MASLSPGYHLSYGGTVKNVNTWSLFFLSCTLSSFSLLVFLSPFFLSFFQDVHCNATENRTSEVICINSSAWSYWLGWGYVVTCRSHDWRSYWLGLGLCCHMQVTWLKVLLAGPGVMLSHAGRMMFLSLYIAVECQCQKQPALLMRRGHLPALTEPDCTCTNNLHYWCTITPVHLIVPLVLVASFTFTAHCALYTSTMVTHVEHIVRWAVSRSVDFLQMPSSKARDSPILTYVRTWIQQDLSIVDTIGTQLAVLYREVSLCQR